MRKQNYSKFKKWPLWCEAEKAHTCVKNPGITIKIQAWIKRHCGDAWNTLVRNLPLVKPVRDQWSDIPLRNLPSETGRYYSRPRIGISDQTYPHFFPIQPPVCRFTSKLRMLRSAINFNRGISCRKKSVLCCCARMKGLVGHAKYWFGHANCSNWRLSQ